MLLDAQNLFSDNQDILAQKTISDNVVAFGAGDISYLPLLIQAVSDFNTLEKLIIEIETDSTSDFSNPVILAQTALTLDKLKAGARFPLSFIPEGNKGYIRLTYTPALPLEAQANGILGQITAGVVVDNGLSYHEIN